MALISELWLVDVGLEVQLRERLRDAIQTLSNARRAEVWEICGDLVRALQQEHRGKYNPHSGYPGCAQPAADCPHEWNVGRCNKCGGYHDCKWFVDDLCVTCGTMA